MLKKPELLAPAGDLEKLRTAYRFGADACYMGVKSMSMRMKIGDVSENTLEDALRMRDEYEKKLYLTMNIHAHESRLNFLEKEIESLCDLYKKGLYPDGVLVSDPGVFSFLKQKCFWIPLHISTQANVLNSEAVEFWVKQGAERVVLARELSLREVKQIRGKLEEKGIDTELESFVHGAMCMAYSGRCLLSNFMSSRDANEGMCAHSCRWRYKMYLEEELRPGKFIPIEEDQGGTMIMSSKDMCMIEHLRDVINAGVDSLKIEGRHKTVYYLAMVTKAYRKALDLAMEGKPPTQDILDIIRSIDTRGYFTGFWYGKPGADGQNYTKRANYNDDFCFGGVVRGVSGGTLEMEVRNTLKKGDKLDLIMPKKTVSLVLNDFRCAETGEKLDAAHPGQGFKVRFEAPEGVNIGDVVRKSIV